MGRRPETRARTTMTRLVRQTTGYSLLEVIFVLGFVITILGIATPQILAGLDDLRTLGAVRYVAARLQRARMEAVTRSVNTAVRVAGTAGTFSVGVYVDGNGDGVRTRDILDGTDPPVQAEERLSEQFPGVDFGAAPLLPAVDPASPPPGSDPIRLGSSDLASFTPLGTSTTGSLYILGPRRNQYVIRLFGETGKTHTLKFNPRSREWEPL